VSIIQEALRRKEEEVGGGGGASPPPAPPPLPPRKSGPGVGVSLLLIFVFLACLGVGGFYLFQHGLRGFLQTGERPGAPREPRVTSRERNLDTANSEAAPSDAGGAWTAFKQEMERIKRLAESDPEPAREAGGAPAPAEAVHPEKSTAANRLAEDPAASEDADEPRAAEAKTGGLTTLFQGRAGGGSNAPDGEWPDLTLTGVLAPGGGEPGAAMLNNRMYSLGDRVDGARLVRIETDLIVLEFQGRERILRVGQSLR
jgi:hypothetical protein